MIRAINKIQQDLFNIFEDDKLTEDAEEHHAHYATSLLPARGAKEPPYNLGKEFQNPVAARKVPSVARLERRKYCEKSFISYRHILVSCDKFENTVKSEC